MVIIPKNFLFFLISHEVLELISLLAPKIGKCSSGHAGLSRRRQLDYCAIFSTGAERFKGHRDNALTKIITIARTISPATIEVVRVHPNIGAGIRGLDLTAPITAEIAETLRHPTGYAAIQTAVS